MVSPVFFAESFDHTGPTTAAWKYPRTGGTYTRVPGPVVGYGARFEGGGNFLDGASGDSFGYQAPREIGWCAWVRLDPDTPFEPGPGDIVLAECLLEDYDTGEPATQQTLAVSSEGTISVLDGFGSLLGESSPGGLPRDGEWHHLEWRTYLERTTALGGFVAVRVDQGEVIREEDIATVADEELQEAATTFRFGNCAADENTVVVELDDVAYYAFDRTEDPQVWQGPKQVVARVPNGPGFVTELEVHGAAANWQAVAERLPDGDTSTVEHGFAALQDDYHLEPGNPLTEGPDPPLGTVHAPFQVVGQFLFRSSVETGMNGWFRLVFPYGGGDSESVAITDQWRYYRTYFPAPTVDVGVQLAGLHGGVGNPDLGDGDLFFCSQFVAEVVCFAAPMAVGHGHTQALWWP